MRSLRSYLVTMATLLVLLVGAATGVLVWRLDSFSRAQSGRQLLDTTRAMSLVVDGRLDAYEGMLRALQSSDSLHKGDWAQFDRRARSTLAGQDAWIVLGDRAGHQLVNTRLPAGAPLPSGRDPKQIWAALDKGQSRVCDLTHGYVERDILCVDVPVVRGGQITNYLSVVFKPGLLRSVLDQRQLSEARYIAVLDRTGRVIWRNRDPARFIGRPATATLQRAMRAAPEGVLPSTSLDGQPTFVAYSRSPVSGWTFVLAMPRGALAGADERALRYGLIAAAVLLAMGVGFGLIASRRVTTAVERLSAAANRIRAGSPPDFQPSGIDEIDQVGAALDAAITERDASQERFNLAQEIGGIGSWEWDILKDEGHVSDAYKQMHGLTDVTGPLRIGQVLDVIHPDDLPGYKARLAAAKLRREPSTNEYRVILPDGQVRWVFAKGRPLFSADGALCGAIGVVIDLTERRAAEERLRLLMREVDHRANNLMAVVQGAVSLSRAPSADELRTIIIGRISALARAHQLLSDSRWRGADLRRLVQDEMLPYTLGDPGRVHVEGAALPLAPAAAQGVAMALHELATNAAKHGALSTSAGRVDIRWTSDANGLRLRWVESGGPPVREPKARGFGATVLQRSLAGAVGGRTQIHWRREGLVCEMEVPLRSLAREPEAADPLAPQPSEA